MKVREELLLLNRLHHLLYGTFELDVTTREVVGRRVVDLDIRLQRLIFHRYTIDIGTSYLGDTKDDVRIDLRLPPDGRHRTCDRRTDDLTETESLIHPGEAMTITIVPFAHQDAAGLSPLHDGVITDVLTTRREARVELTAEQEDEVFVEPTTTIVAGVDDDCIVVAVLTEELLVGIAVAVRIHRGHDDVGDTATTELLDHILTLLYPAAVEEILLRRLTDGADELLEALTRLRIVEGDADALTDLTIEVELYGTISIDHFAIDLLDDHTGLDLVTEVRERTTSEDLLDLEAIARVLLIVEGAKVTRLLSPTLGEDTTTRV